MNLSIGIVGLPNVGKSTLFNALLKKQVALVANYPFATIDPNVGVVDVPDERLEKLADVVAGDPSTPPAQRGTLRMNRPPVIPATVQFYDIAGLVKGASVGEGLGNKFLAHIREVESIAHVVRLFEDDTIINVQNTVDPKNDMETVEAELMLADLSTLLKQREPKSNTATTEQKYTYQVVQKVISLINKGIPVRKQSLSDEELEAIRHLNLLTAKPVLFVVNVSESQLSDMQNTEKLITDVLTSMNEPAQYVVLNAKLETEVLALSPAEQQEYLAQFKLSQTGLNRFIQKAYSLLNLISFLTAGVKEVRAWTIKKGTLAPQAAGTIHTDFEKKFIKADVIPYSGFVENNGWVNAHQLGKVQIVGKDYVMKDGDVVEFKIGT